ncbi:MAG: DUF4388 domain-containing protein [Acidobacteriota bacterium]
MANCSNPRCARPRPSNNSRCLSCQALLVGTLVRHRYEVQKTVGKGGFGITYLVGDQDCFNEARILKELCPQAPSNQTDEDEEDIGVTAERLFKREAQVLLNLQHPGIPKLYAYFTEAGYSYLVQDFIPGHTLSEEVDEQKKIFSEEEARATLGEIADILEYLHTSNPPIVHRDIKPQNLMRHASGRLLLIDFGAVCQAASTAASSQTLIGSPGYAPPEQIFGHPVPQSDLYAAGATVLRLLTGVHPSQLFNNKTQSMEWESRIRVSPEFAGLLNDLLVRDVHKRLSSALELKRRLQLLTTTTAPPIAPLPTIQQPKITPYHTAIQSQGTHRLPNNDAPPTMFFEESLGSSSQFANTDRPADEVGQLEVVPILFLLRRFYRERLSGRLTCINGAVIKTIHFDEGAVVFAHSSVTNERLGELLLRVGRITKADFDKATEIMRARSLRFGAALIEMKRISVEELKPLIIDQVANIVYSLFAWSAGQYEVRRERPPEESIKISLSTADIIFEGLRRLENIDLIKHWLGDFTRKLATTSDPLLLYQSVNLNPKEAFIVSRIDSVMSVEEILSLGGLPEADTLKTLCGLLAVGILEWVDNAKPLRTSVPIANVLNKPQVIPSDFDIQTAAAFCYEVENTLRTLQNASHYVVLGLTRTASDEEVREAYGQLARKFHPDRHTQLANYNLSLRADLEKIFTRISEAYRTLSDPISREGYDRMYRTSSKIKIPTGLKEPYSSVQINSESVIGERITEKPPERTAAATSLPATRPTATPPLNSSNPPHNEPDSGKQKILPQASPRSLEAGKQRLGTPPVSTPPMPTDGSPSGRHAALTSARTWFEKGLEYYNAKLFGQACRAFQAAATAAPKEPEYRIFLARSFALMKGYFTEAEQEFYKAIELAPHNADYYAELGLFYQKINLFNQANEMFERALAISPNHLIALRAKEAPRR